MAVNGNQDLPNAKPLYPMKISGTQPELSAT